ncbi:MAG: carboxymuconolactone decarboxylase family protein [Acidimicrobiia bacterium]
MTGERLSTPRVPPVEKVAARAREVAAGGLVRPVNLTATLAHNRPVSKAIAAMSSVFFDPEILDPRLRELVILRTGWVTQAVYEFGQHVLAARQVGISEEEIRRTTLPPEQGGWTELERAALRMVDDLHRDDTVSAPVWSALEELAGHERAIALIALAGFYRMLAGVLNGLGIQPEDDLPRWPA